MAREGERERELETEHSGEKEKFPKHGGMKERETEGASE